jgi:hypothetical protein
MRDPQQNIHASPIPQNHPRHKRKPRQQRHDDDDGGQYQPSDLPPGSTKNLAVSMSW